MDISSSRMQQSTPLTEANDHSDSLENPIVNLMFEYGLEPTFLRSPVFKKFSRSAQVEVPNYEAVMDEQLKKTKLRERELRQQWERSGCTVILDSWKSQFGNKNFISVLVHCSKGMFFLRSMDVSAIIDDVDELASLLCHVVDYVGAHNIVQIVTNDASAYMQAAEHAVLKKHDSSFFFTVCADSCINRLLDKIAAFAHVNDVLLKAREITRFIYSNTLAYELKGRYIQKEILSRSPLKFVAVFISLERLVSEREKLVKMFSLPEWDSSDWTSNNVFRFICGIVKTDNAFWHDANEVLKVTMPLVRVLYKLEESDNCPMGILYDAMDSAKEDIKRDLGDKHGVYWHLVDTIWDHYLHTPLHAAGYVLNPRLFYKDQLCCGDPEISAGITKCTTRMAKGHYDPSKVDAQMEVYKIKSGCFDSDSATQQMMEIPQVDWWLEHGTGTPELQNFAIRILSQTCFGATRYNINRRVSEMLHGEGRTYTERQWLCNLEYVHYNIYLADAVPCIGGLSWPDELMTPTLGDWITYPGH